MSILALEALISPSGVLRNISLYNFEWEVAGMLYRIAPQTDALKLYREPRSGSKLPYRTVKEMKQLYPNENFAVIGEIGGVVRPPKEGDRLLLGDGKTISILPRGSLRKPFEWVDGYIAVNSTSYLAAIKGLIPSFLRR